MNFGHELSEGVLKCKTPVQVKVKVTWERTGGLIRKDLKGEKLFEQEHAKKL